MLSFQSPQLVHPRVVLRIGPLRRVQHVIQILVVTKLFAQRFDALFRRRIGGWRICWAIARIIESSGSGKLEILDLAGKGA